MKRIVLLALILLGDFLPMTFIATAYPLPLAWQQEGYRGSSTTDKKGNVYALTAGYYDDDSPHNLAKFSLFGNRIWEIDLTAAGFVRTLDVESAADGNVVVFGVSATGLAGYARFRSSDGSPLGGAFSSGLPVIEPYGIPRMSAAVAPSGLVLFVVQPPPPFVVGQRLMVVAWNTANEKVWEHSLPQSAANAYLDVGPTGQIWVAFGNNDGGTCLRLNPATGATRSEADFSISPSSLMALSSGAVIAGRRYDRIDTPYGFFYATSTGFGRVDANGNKIAEVYDDPWKRIPNASSGNGRHTFCEDRHTGAVYWGLTTGNYVDDGADGETNGFAIMKVGRDGVVKWEHRYQTTAISMAAPGMATDALGGLVVCGFGAQVHSYPNRGWCRLFRLSPEGTRFAEREPLPNFSAADFHLNLGLFPVVSGPYHTQEEPVGPVRGSSLVQLPPLVPKGPLVLSQPTLKRRSGQYFLTAPVLGGHGRLTWRWYKNDRPIPGPAGAVKELPVIAGNREFPRDAYFVEVKDARGHSSVSATVQP